MPTHASPALTCPFPQAEVTIYPFLQIFRKLFETVRTSVESEPLELGGATTGSEQLSVQESPPKLPSLRPDCQKISSAIIEANASQISSVQTLRDILYNAYGVRFEVRNDTPYLLYKKQEEEMWVPILP